ncbi:NmrA family NAD(P)-binding protein [Naumannella cuiyingiana]|uniref:Uncharacterized protein YbjT (DUF2867 family) n=1 Tax=Naumannella cuiyingiana TaxID=1347891 RepID=A0A7Z0IJU1_9ACTN|nr:NmrA family NAD(P)-binding protein [Naumannella cuiyingiana]NYI69904.1 uncharacterized protein YbjT (DUF2867 family) [Naumannella cuiyingiana]
MNTTHVNPDARPIAITCPRGKTSRHVIDALAERGVPTRPVGRSEAITFDWNAPETWTPALQGARAAYLVYQPDLAMPGAAEAIASLAALARDAGLDHLVLLSGRNEPGAQEAERALQSSGVDATVVTASWFAQNFTEGLFAPFIAAGELPLPADDCPEPFTDTRDIAEVVVAALTDPAHRGRRYEVSGSRAYTFAEAAALLAETSGRPVELRRVEPEEFVARLAGIGIGADDARGITELFAEILDGRNSTPVEGVREALGRPARDLRAVLADNR